ncbi:maltase A1-like [Condylostylus longicornis]|uniref:maltase A1-like n=1 Tax=Condylostylus longicornis TaxID=2530218 RepID=UPI00244E3CA4|nr:maltase A1-like [Condylostylus longicornis]
MFQSKLCILLHIVLVFILITLTKGCPDVNTKGKTIEKDWWETSSFYQIYPRSFKDSNGDGIGDLKGIKSKLQHLKDIGVNATWLSPIYKSPMVDFGYDISDFYEINPDYGTMKDFEELIEEAKKLGIKIILDFVPNHSSDENIWFQKSIKRIEPYTDYYVWHKGKPNPDGGRPLPPSNWLQAFRGSAWEWNEERQEYYLHQFDIKQPDLNYRNPVVVEQMKHVLRYWLNKGVAGFRVDAVPWCFEVAPKNGEYPDEPPSGFTQDKEEAAYLSHIYTQDQPETVDMVFQWRQLLDDYQRIHGGDTRVLMIETYSSLDNVMKFYGTRSIKGAQMPFNFQFILQGNKDSSAKDITNIIKSWFNNMPGAYTPNWVMGNHDQRRVASRYGVDKIDTMNMILMILPGAAITYNGDEIGMIDGDIKFEDSKDPAAIRAGPEKYQKFTRDPARTPMQWDDSTSAGVKDPIL